MITLCLPFLHYVLAPSMSMCSMARRSAARLSVYLLLPVCPYARMPVCPYARMPVCPLHAARCTLPVCPYARCTLPAARCPLHTARCPLPAARCTLHAARCPLHAARCPLPAARCPLHAARCPLPVDLPAARCPLPVDVPAARLTAARTNSPSPSPSPRSSINRALKADLQRKLRSSPTSQYQRLLEVRGRLPAFAMRDEIVQAIRSHQVTVIAGDTGCGKTTQVPQCVLDDMILSSDGANANIVVTQPRRISAIGVSERIASERCEHLGGTCGYSIKLERKASSATRLLFCTTGILLRRLQCDPDLASVSHGEFPVYAGCPSCSHLTVSWALLVFVDEVHERDINTDFLLIILKALLHRRTSLKLVLMSATLNAEEFASYFENTALVSIPGRAYPVAENRLEDVLQLTGYQIREGSGFCSRDQNSPARISKNDLRKRYSKYSSDVVRSVSLVDETIINYELLADLVEHITQNCDDGAILIFLPGLLEIGKAIDELRKKEIFQGPRALIYPLHSSLSSIDQRAVFSVPEKGVRKIVVATNIAETSITIEGEIS
jgi:HrpA-like RNA helicase